MIHFLFTWFQYLNKPEKRPISWQFCVVDTSHNIHFFFSKPEQMSVSVEIRVESSDMEFSETTQPESILVVGSPEGNRKFSINH